MTQNNKPIAVTGGIGSGKSEVIKIFNELGYKTIDCDKITADVYKKCSVKRQLKKAFPNAVTGLFNTKIDRKLISKEVFYDKNKYLQLKNIVTDKIFDIALKRAKKSSKPIVIEIPLLFEGGYDKYFDKIIVVLRDKKQRISAVQNRNGLTEEEIIKRMENQLDYDSTDFSKHIIITNNGNLEEVKEQILKIIKTDLN